METAMVCAMALAVLLSLVNLICLLMVGSVVVQMLDILSKLPEELRAKPREKKDDNKPWWSYV